MNQSNISLKAQERITYLENRLHQSIEKEVRYKALLESIQDALIIFDADYKIIYINHNLKKLVNVFGFKCVSRGILLSELVGEHSLNEWQTFLLEGFSGKSAEYIKQMFVQSHQSNYYKIHVNPINVLQNSVTHVAVFIRDVTSEILTSNQQMLFGKSNNIINLSEESVSTQTAALTQDLLKGEEETQKRQHELERMNKRLRNNEEVLKKALATTKKREKELNEKNQQLATTEEELRQSMEALKTVNETVLEKQQALENYNKRFQDNEHVLRKALEKTKRRESELEERNAQLTATEEELRQNMEELHAINEAMSQKQHELEQLNERFKANEDILKKSLEKTRKREKELEEKNSQLITTEEELRQNMEELHTINEAMEIKQHELTSMNTRMKANEEVIKKALMRTKKREKELEEKNAQLIATEEELRQNMEELHTINEVMEQKQRELESVNIKLKGNEEVLLKALKRTQKKEADLQKANDQLVTAEEELRQSMEALRINKEELDRQNEEKNQNIATIQAQNKHIIDSINYAKTIQSAMLPSEAEMKQLFEDSFIVYRPKDIVSGDFYWAIQRDNKKFIAVLDCTGHGVPGAFMSIIGYSLLNELINQQHLTDPAEILTHLHDKVRSILGQNREDNFNRDGMDIALCVLEEKNDVTKLLFAGAKRPLLYVNSETQELLQLKGDRKPIGGGLEEFRTGNFETKEIFLAKGDIFYLYSDGFTDQNNEERRKFGKKRLIHFIKEYAEESLREQKKIFENALVAHQGESLQRDDITLLGVRV